MRIIDSFGLWGEAKVGKFDPARRGFWRVTERRTDPKNSSRRFVVAFGFANRRVEIREAASPSQTFLSQHNRNRRPVHLPPAPRTIAFERAEHAGLRIPVPRNHDDALAGSPARVGGGAHYRCRQEQNK